jgi:hypothetical protein
VISYDNWNTGPRRYRPSRRRPPRRHGTWIAVALLVVVLLIAWRTFLSSSSAGSSPGTATSGGAVSSAIRPAGFLALGACIDPTLSIVRSFAPAIRGDLARAVGSLAPPAGPLPTSAAPAPRSGVSLTIREVETHSFSSNPGRYARTVLVPGVPGLLHARPGASAQHYDRQLRAWSRGYRIVMSARHAAAQAAARAARVIATLPLNQSPKNNSGITACISALLTTVPPNGLHSYLLTSDLEQNVPSQLGGSFDNAPLLIIQTCDSGNESFCHGLLERFLAAMHLLHVGQVTVIRPENAGQAIGQWIRTGEVTQ